MNRGLGYVYLILGHEMLHYALADRETVDKHHCLFVEKGYREQIVEFLVSSGIAHPLLRVVQESSTGCSPAPRGQRAPAGATELTGGP